MTSPSEILDRVLRENSECTLSFTTHEAAWDYRMKLYGVRRRARQTMMRSVDPSAPSYGHTPWDDIWIGLRKNPKKPVWYLLLSPKLARTQPARITFRRRK